MPKLHKYHLFICEVVQFVAIFMCLGQFESLNDSVLSELIIRISFFKQWSLLFFGHFLDSMQLPYGVLCSISWHHQRVNLSFLFVFHEFQLICQFYVCILRLFVDIPIWLFIFTKIYQFCILRSACSCISLKFSLLLSFHRIHS